MKQKSSRISSSRAKELRGHWTSPTAGRMAPVPTWQHGDKAHHTTGEAFRLRPRTFHVLLLQGAAVCFGTPHFLFACTTTGVQHKSPVWCLTRRRRENAQDWPFVILNVWAKWSEDLYFQYETKGFSQWPSAHHLQGLSCWLKGISASSLLRVWKGFRVLH